MRTRLKHGEGEERVLDHHYLTRLDFADDYWAGDRVPSETIVKKFRLGYNPISNRHTIPYRNPSGDLLGIIQRLK
jgi:hypothetical protein